VPLYESLKKLDESSGMPDKISNGTGLTKFPQIYLWLKVKLSSKVLTLSYTVFCSKDLDIVFDAEFGNFLLLKTVL
jgi:hypothetical protein